MHPAFHEWLVVPSADASALWDPGASALLMGVSWSLELGTTPQWPIALALLAALAFTGLELRTLWRTQSHRRRSLALLFGARGLALVLVAAALFELNLRLPDPRAQQRRLAVLADSSHSMSIAEREQGPTRFERARSAWRDNADARAAWGTAGVRPELLRFGESLRPADSRGTSDKARSGTTADAPDDAFGAAPATDEASDLIGALSALEAESSTRTAPLAGALVMSDGLVAADDAARSQLLESASSSDIPIHTVFTARPQIVDAAVGPIAAGEFAFVENVTTFEAELFTHGLEGQSLTVELLLDGEAIARESLRVGAETQRKVQFEIAPEQTGQFVYEVAIVPVDGEATTLNNRRPFVLEVLRDKIRVLHVAGRPDWDVRALRTLLRRDPNVELLSYYILRDEEDSLRSDDSAPMSLIAFPTQELFHEQLGSFDLIVLHNFDAMTHGNYLGNLAKYVDDGGSLVVIGGDMGLAGGDYARSPLEPLLPLDLRRPLSLERKPFRPQLTEAGRRHPITGWIAAGESSAWDQLPALDSFNRGALNSAPKLGAISLLDGPGGAPLLSVAEPGRGRTLILATGATWRLGFAPDLPLIDGARPYDLLWLGIIRWVLRDKAAERLRVETDRDHYTPRESIDVRARTLSPSYQPEPEVELEWTLRQLPARANKVQEGGTWTTDALGRHRQSVGPLEPGAYELEVWRAGVDDAPRARRVFVVGSRTQELADLQAQPGRSLLEEIAQRSGGEFFDASDASPSLPAQLAFAEDRRGAVARTRDLPLWNGWLALLALLATLPLEWWIRRRSGLV